MRRFAESMTWAEGSGFAIDAAVNDRVRFIRRTYLHLVGELGGVALATVVVLQNAALQQIAIGIWNSLFLYLAAFFGLSLLTRKLLEGRKSLAVQYAGAGLWVFFLGLLVAPLAMTAQAMRLAFGGAFHKDGAGAFGRFVEMLLRDDAGSSDLPGRPVEGTLPEPTADEERAALLRRALEMKREMG